MSHHTDAGSDDHRHDHGAERHHHHHHGRGHGHERHPGPRLEAHASGSPQEIAGYLDDLANAIRAGGIQMRFGERAVGLRLNGEVTLDLRAAGGNGGTSDVNLSLSWRAPQPPPPPTPPAPKLSISPLQTPEPGSAAQPEGQSGPGEMGQEPYGGGGLGESMSEGQAFGG